MFAVLIGFSGCGEDFSPQIKNLNERLDSTNRAATELRNDLNARIVQLTTLLNSKVSVESVEPVNTGGRQGYRLILSNGETFEIFNGTNGTSGSVWTIDATTGNWVCDGVATNYRAVGLAAPSPYINPADTFWHVYEWNAASMTYNDRKTDYKATGNEMFISYVTQDAQGNFVLHVRNQQDANKWETIPLNTSVSVPSGGFIEMIGYVQGSAINGNANLALSSIQQTANLEVDFGWLSALPPGYTTWNFRKPVQAGQMLSALANKNTAIVINTNLTSLTNLKFRNSSGAVLPIKFGTPTTVTGVLTRSDGPSAGTFFLIPIDLIDSVQTDMAAFKNRFVSNALYYLEAGTTVVKSNYTTWSIAANGKDAATPVAEALVTALNSAPLISGDNPIARNTYIGITFDANGDNVYDYHVTSHNSNIVVNNTNGTFSTANALTDTVFVHKLLIDGRLLTDTIRITAP
jgi:hypothetical protein